MLVTYEISLFYIAIGVLFCYAAIIVFTNWLKRPKDVWTAKRRPRTVP